MDIQANEIEQLEVAEAIIEIWDACPESGEPTEHQLNEIYSLAYRLAELVTAAKELKNRK